MGLGGKKKAVGGAWGVDKKKGSSLRGALVRLFFNLFLSKLAVYFKEGDIQEEGEHGWYG